MTSVVTTVRCGSQERVLVHREGRGFPLEASLADLSRYVAEASAERQRLRAADVEVPAEVLRLGFAFIDTPGVGSAIEANTAITRRFLPEADAVVFVTSVESPLTADELAFLAEVRHHVRKLFLVVNKADVVSAREIGAVIGYIRAQLAERMGGVAPPLRPVPDRLQACARQRQPAAEAHHQHEQADQAGRHLSTGIGFGSQGSTTDGGSTSSAAGAASNTTPGVSAFPSATAFPPASRRRGSGLVR
jgi:Dynamin family